MVLPDHPTPCEIKTHTHEPVPFCFYSPNINTSSQMKYSEITGKKTSTHFQTPWDLLEAFLNQK